MKRRSILLIIIMFCIVIWGIFSNLGTGNEKGHYTSEDLIEELYNMSDELGYKNALSELTKKAITSVDRKQYYRFQQNYKGIPVYGRTLVYVIGENGEKISVTGNVIDIDEEVPMETTITQTYVEEKIFNYMMDMLEIEDEIEINISDINMNNLCIYSNEYNECYLAYQVETIFCTDNNIGIYEILIDANTGTILKTNSLLNQDVVIGNIEGQNKKYEKITYEKEGESYQLANEEYKIDTSMVETEKIYHWWHSLGNWKKIDVAIGNNSTDFNKNLVTWNNGEKPDAASVDAYVNTLVTYEYFKEILEQVSTNDEGNALIHIVTGMDYVKDDEGEFGYRTWSNNAYSYSISKPEAATVLVFGVGKNGQSSSSEYLDVVAHEYMHGVTRFHADLLYENESGAIDEALSDIFGELVETWHMKKKDSSYVTDWIHGNRNIKNPAIGKYPSNRYEENNSGEDYVHGYSTVISHSAYLMWNGIDGDESKKITENELAKLWYNAMLMMPSDCTFEMCRFLVEVVAQDMGLKDKQIECIGESFDYVGIYSEEFAYQLSRDGVLQVIGEGGEKFDDYTVYICPIDVNKETYLFFRNNISSEKVIVESTETRTAISEEPLSLNLQEGIYKIVIENNCNKDQKAVRTILIGDNGADTLAIQTDFKKEKISEDMFLETMKVASEIAKIWNGYSIYNNKNSVIYKEYHGQQWPYYQVIYSDVNTIQSLKTLTEKYYTQEAMEDLIEYVEYIENEGKLFTAAPMGMGGPAIKEYNVDVRKVNDEKYDITITSYYEASNIEPFSVEVSYVYSNNTWLFDKVFSFGENVPVYMDDSESDTKSNEQTEVKFMTTISEADEKSIRITNAQELYEKISDNPNGSFVLESDIDLSTFNSGQWIPMCSVEYDKRFSGILDGQGHIIKNLNINLCEYAGLFSGIDGGIIKNLGVEIGHMYGAESAGGLAAVGTGTIDNCFIKCDCISAGDYAGGVLGSSFDESPKLSHISVSGNINVQSNASYGAVGGIVGICDDISINDADVSCDIQIEQSVSGLNGQLCAGGLIGKTSDSKIIELKNIGILGNISALAVSGRYSTMQSGEILYEGTSSYTGGIIGLDEHSYGSGGFFYDNYIILDNCNVEVDIKSDSRYISYAAGVIASTFGTNNNGYVIDMKDCSYKGIVEAKATSGLASRAGGVFASCASETMINNMIVEGNITAVDGEKGSYVGEITSSGNEYIQMENVKTK